jgi:hypothetical protein
MRPRVAIYVREEELAQIKREAARRRVSVSRYLKERVAPAFPDAPDNPLTPETEQRLIDAVRRTANGALRNALDQISTLIVMVDQLALRQLGDEGHKDWQKQVEELLRRLRSEQSESPSATNGAHA